MKTLLLQFHLLVYPLQTIQNLLFMGNRHGSRMEIKMIFVPKALSTKRNAKMMQMMFKNSVITERDSGTKFTRTTASPEILPLTMWFGFMKK